MRILKARTSASFTIKVAVYAAVEGGALSLDIEGCVHLVHARAQGYLAEVSDPDAAARHDANAPVCPVL
jgi:hypothetical protein